MTESTDHLRKMLEATLDYAVKMGGLINEIEEKKIKRVPTTEAIDTMLRFLEECRQKMSQGEISKETFGILAATLRALIRAESVKSEDEKKDVA